MPGFIGCGAQYDPVFWDVDVQREHVRLMREAGLAFVRLFEFCWSAFEPAEGQYDFDWSDGFLDLLDANGIRAVVSTPGAVPPRWLTSRYPEAAVMDADGQRNRCESRRHGCPSCPDYMARLLEMARRLAERYGADERVIGWQIDNELGHPVCYCPLCEASFRAWLQRRFETLDDANRRLGLRVWSREYSSWDQVRIPRPGAAPQLRHAFRQWTSQHWIQYVERHTDVLRRYVAAPITTNMMAPWHGYDHYAMAPLLDVIGMDYYVYGQPAPENFGDCNTDLDFNLGYTRGIAEGAPFWIMETDIAGGGRKLPSPGKLAQWTWRHIAHGADLINYFRWDCPPFGAEGGGFGAVGPGTWPSAAVDEAKQVCGEVRRVASALDGTRPQRAEVALVFSYAAWWKWLDAAPCRTLATHRMHGYPFLVRRHCHGLLENGVPFDLVGPGGDWSGYACIIVPECPVVDRIFVQRCLDYVESGGCLLMTPMSAMFDTGGVQCDAPYPAGALKDAFGIACGPHGVLVPDGQGVTLPVDDCVLHPEGWVDRLDVRAADTEVLLRYRGTCYEGLAALTARQQGEGRALYFGTVLPQAETPALYRMLIPHLGVQSGPRPSQGVWMRFRVGDDGRRVQFVQNMTDLPAVTELEGLGAVTIPPHDTLVRVLPAPSSDMEVPS